MSLFVYCVLVTCCVGKIEIVCSYVWACVPGCSGPGLEREMSGYRAISREIGSWLFQGAETLCKNSRGLDLSEIPWHFPFSQVK